MKKLLTLILILFSVFAWSQTAWINEFHYDNTGVDQDEMIEIVLQDYENYNLNTFNINLLNGVNNSVYNTKTLGDYILGDTLSNYAIYYYVYPKNGIQNGPDAIEITHNGIRLEIIGYEGYEENDSIYDIGQETGSTPIGFSLQKTDSLWVVDTASPGKVNTHQTILPEEEPYDWEAYFAFQQARYDSICAANGHTWTKSTGSSYKVWGSPKISDSIIYVIFQDYSCEIYECIICGVDSIHYLHYAPPVYDSIVTWEEQ